MLAIRPLDSLADVDAAQWDALVGQDDPFVEHAFLSALEASGSVGGDTGWLPRHLTVWDGDRLIGALPLYEKDHSYGEYIFDWAWADAANRIGIPYYPKLVSMVPVTPATGTRLLVHPASERGEVIQGLIDGAFQVAEELRASSVHWLFVSEGEAKELGRDARLMRRTTQQFHWHNDAYKDFDDYLARFRSSARKQVRKERRRARESGLELRVIEGCDMTDREWSVLPSLYRDTCGRKGSYPYLTPLFFREIRRRCPELVVCAMAFDGERPVAASLNFEKGAHLYGRYWGCSADYDALHFELCYYQLIDRAIQRKMARFEAGAQGMHKLKRGLMPSPVHSMHWIRHPVLADAVGEYLPREATQVRRQIGYLEEHGPFKRGC